MVEVWIMHMAFMIVFFGLPVSLGLYQYKKWKKINHTSLISKIKKDLGINF